MFIKVLFTMSTLLLCFIGSTLADQCYHSGYKFADLLGDADLNNTIRTWCQRQDGRQFKNGETITNSCIDFRANSNANAHIDLHIQFVISDKSGIAKFTAEACKEVLYLATDICPQGTWGKTINYDGQHASDPDQVSARSLRSAKDRSGEGDDEENSDDGAQRNDEDGPFSTIFVTTTDETTGISTTTFTPVLITRTVYDIISTTKTETTWVTGTTQATSSSSSSTSSSSSSSTSSSTSDKSVNHYDCLLGPHLVMHTRPKECSKFNDSPKPKTSTTSINSAFAANIRLDPNGYACSTPDIDPTPIPGSGPLI